MSFYDSKTEQKDTANLNPTQLSRWLQNEYDNLSTKMHSLEINTWENKVKNIHLKEKLDYTNKEVKNLRRTTSFAEDLVVEYQKLVSELESKKAKLEEGLKNPFLGNIWMVMDHCKSIRERIETELEFAISKKPIEKYIPATTDLERRILSNQMLLKQDELEMKLRIHLRLEQLLASILVRFLMKSPEIIPNKAKRDDTIRELDNYLKLITAKMLPHQEKVIEENVAIDKRLIEKEKEIYSVKQKFGNEKAELKNIIEKLQAEVNNQIETHRNFKIMHDAQLKKAEGEKKELSEKIRILRNQSKKKEYRTAREMRRIAQRRLEVLKQKQLLEEQISQLKKKETAIDMRDTLQKQIELMKVQAVSEDERKTIDKKLNELEKMETRVRLPRPKDGEVRWLSAFSEPQSREDIMEDIVFGISHQLRNRLGIIQSAVDQCHEAAQLPEEAKRHLEVILRNAVLMGQRMEEFHDFTRKVRYSFKSYSLIKILNRVISLISAKTDKQNIHITTEFPSNPPELPLDPERLEEAFLQIAVNSIEAMPRGGILTFSAGISASEIYIKITDTGAGIERSQTVDIWKPFFTTKTGSLGLGLPVTKRIVEHHGGRVFIESKEGKGVTVTCKFPLG